MATQTLNARKRRVFDSVFGAPAVSLPTPYATPAAGFVAPGQAWGGPSPSRLEERLGSSWADAKTLQPASTGIFPAVEEHVEDQVKWDRAWHLLTHTLTLPSFDQDGFRGEGLKPESRQLDDGFYNALRQVLNPGTQLPRARQTEDLVVWYTAQVRRHFLNQVLPVLYRFLQQQPSKDMLVGLSLQVLRASNRQYFHDIEIIARGIESLASGTSKVVTESFKRDLHAIVSNFTIEPLRDALVGLLKTHVFVVLGIPTDTELQAPSSQPEGQETEEARNEVLRLVGALQASGLAGGVFQVIFAEVMNEAMTQYVRRGWQGVWSSDGSEKSISTGERRDGSILPRTAHNAAPSRCVTELCEWIEDRYAKLVVQVFSVLDMNGQVTWADKEKYKEMGVGQLAELRIRELFDIVVDWPNSRGALDDLRTAITTPQRRLYLTEAFLKTLQERLLHPGTSTLQILQTYISMIWSFHALDHSKVLLDRVAYPLQLYLCSREDTVRIIIAGLLSETEDAEGNPIKSSDKLVELAHLLNKGPDEDGVRANDDELDWHDMDWTPDPVDAGPGYKRSKNADIIGTLIGVLGAQEVFIKEFQNIIGEHLLRNDGDFNREIKVLDLLKLRFGDPPLQACEVMMKDIQDSTRVNSIIRHKQALGTSDDVAAAPPNPGFLQIFTPPQPQLNSPRPAHDPVQVAEDASLSTSIHAKILSRLFWPSLNDERYKVPPAISSLQKKYERGFEELKSARKLTWLPALGQATVELEFDDRTVMEEVHTWQAAVIYAFNDEDPNPNEPVTRTVEQLEEELEMDEDLIISALRFWVGKSVLRETSPSTYTVLETLDTLNREGYTDNTLPSTSHPANPAAGSESSTGLGASRQGRDGAGGMGSKAKAKESDKMAVYWSFVQGMLKNSQKEMPVAQIGMMLKMLIVEGFPYSNEELKDWLGGKVQEGKLECKAGKYRLKG